MAGKPASRTAYEELLELPDTVVGEIVDGERHVSPRPAPPHAFASGALSGELIPPFQKGKGGPGGWIIVPEPELHIAGQIIVPDLAGWRTERMPQLPQTAFF